MARTLDQIEAAKVPWPKEIRISPDKMTLRIGFDDDQVFDIAAELLRVESPSAEVQGHGAGQKKLVAGKRAVQLITAEPNGNYAVRLGFDDGHATGIYTWRYLRYVGENQETLLGDYMDALDEFGLERDV